MATRAKYTRVRAAEENKEEKPDTDILMRFSPRYGKSDLIQASMSPELSLSSLVKAKISSPSRQPSVLWTRLSGLLKSYVIKSKAFIKSSVSTKEKLLMFGNLVNRDS